MHAASRRRSKQEAFQNDHAEAASPLTGAVGANRADHRLDVQTFPDTPSMICRVSGGIEVDA
jgi:hypothetical protein